jgi:hypothetical protein
MSDQQEFRLTAPTDEMEELFFLDRYTDEVAPCALRREAWAEWLATPDEMWGCHDGANDGERFLAVIVPVCDVVATWTEEGVWHLPDPPLGFEHTALRHGRGLGWDEQSMGNTEHIREMLQDGGGFVGQTEVIACFGAERRFEVEFRAGPPPQLVDVETGEGAA